MFKNRYSLNKMCDFYPCQSIYSYLIHDQFVPFETRYPPEWFQDPSAPNPHMELDQVPVSETWSAMEKLTENGLARNIGLANFNCQAIRDLFSYAKIKPSVLQVWYF